MPESRPGRGGKGASRLGLRHDVDPVETVGAQGLLLHDQRPVEVLAALGREKDLRIAQHRQNPVEHRLGNFGAGVGTDLFAADLARGAADHKEVSGGKLRRTEQLGNGGARPFG